MHEKQNCPLTKLKNRNYLTLKFRTNLPTVLQQCRLISCWTISDVSVCLISIFYYISICLLSFNIRNSSTITILTQKIRGHSLMNLRILKVLLIFAFKLFFHSLCTRPVIPKVCSADREISSSGPRIPIQINILCFTEHLNILSGPCTGEVWEPLY